MADNDDRLEDYYRRVMGDKPRERPVTRRAPSAGEPISSPGKPANPAPTWRERAGSSLRTGLLFAIGYVAVIWGVHLINVFAFGGGLTQYGIRPLDTSSLIGVLFSPVLHVSFGHLISNTVPGAIFSFLIGLSGARAWWGTTAFVVLIGGLGTWFFGGVGTVHVGASLLVYGWLAYLLVRGIFNRSIGQIILGVVLGIAYSGLLWGVLPINEGVSWQAHLFGALGGVAAGVVFGERRRSDRD
ncbi:rhomboid family intramembrane serine protease [Corynebacterium otitidis]|uniref:Peptidase S54 rhomboid domain-containing protein n=1 Tax=Corynebacterium otitidis ATCC 51513 TaxID=883169 RepID=I7LB32_9CORY|nr:rhomboid family intramembrane serine protease [Corynebacterium otitidis]EJZ82500.1 hypothetical protein HMPREF9719_00563 [Corynebacterium otitidis ATCC 51513]KKO83918.1 membrane protein [Corynebacterium otitidis]CCI82779.1 hypothetical protein BN46_0020 [Corynebacterium otitidis ATCC 51513]